MTLTGRPTCAAIPMALEDLRTSGSLACVGARVYADLGTDESLAVVPASEFLTLAEELERAGSMNQRLEAVHRQARAGLAG
jgi:uncharacterized protein (DUF169 family)